MPLLICLLLGLVSSVSSAKTVSSGVATGAPGVAFPWATAEKQGFGTAYEAYDSNESYTSDSPTAPVTHTWFTIARGILTETFYPRIDMAQSRDTQLLVTDGQSFIHQEQYDTQHTVERIAGAPLYKITNRDRWNRYVIYKWIWADPNTDTIIQKIRVEKNIPGLRFYVLHKPAAANSLFGDSATTQPFIAGETNGLFTGFQGLAASIPFKKTSVGYVGKSDGWTDLLDFKMDYEFSESPYGNVALTGELDISPATGTEEFQLFLFFGRNERDVRERHATISQLDVQASERQFKEEWKQYLAQLKLPKPTGDARSEFLVESSALVLKSAEDKTYAGSVIASPSHPWGETSFESGLSSPERNSSYHVVWPRDLYHIANGFLAIGDKKTPIAILRRLRQVQLTAQDGRWEFGSRIHSKEGSFPQNFWVDGRPVYGGYQADETAMPILLAHRLWKEGLVGLDEVSQLARLGGTFLSEMGPWTQNERWEEAYGISPNTAAYVIAALKAAAEIGFQAKEESTAERFQSLSEDWSHKPNDNIDTWTFTTNGKIQGQLGDGRYYQRLDGATCDSHGGAIWDAIWDPNHDGLTSLANWTGPERFRYESEIVDGGFLALVRVGLRPASDPLIRETLPEIDSLIRRNTSVGMGFYRYRFDGYGEEKQGRLWPLLTGERIIYDASFLKEQGIADVTPALLTAYQGLENFANAQGIFSEQVWDEGPLEGKQTGSAAPLLWSHAEFLQVAKTLSH